MWFLSYGINDSLLPVQLTPSRWRCACLISFTWQISTFTEVPCQLNEYHRMCRNVTCARAGDSCSLLLWRIITHWCKRGDFQWKVPGLRPLDMNEDLNSQLIKFLFGISNSSSVSINIYASFNNIWYQTHLFVLHFSYWKTVSVCNVSVMVFLDPVSWRPAGDRSQRSGNDKGKCTSGWWVTTGSGFHIEGFGLLKIH